jgi:hypothetical protein
MTNEMLILKAGVLQEQKDFPGAVAVKDDKGELVYFTFAWKTREDYVYWRAAWRSIYAQLSDCIRQQKRASRALCSAATRGAPDTIQATDEYRRANVALSELLIRLETKNFRSLRDGSWASRRAMWLLAMRRASKLHAAACYEEAHKPVLLRTVEEEEQTAHCGPQTQIVVRQ